MERICSFRPCFFEQREKNFEEFSKHLKGLVDLYKLPGDKYVFNCLFILFLFFLTPPSIHFDYNFFFFFLPCSKLKTKMYIALQSLELDLTKMMHMFRSVFLPQLHSEAQGFCFWFYFQLIGFALFFFFASIFPPWVLLSTEFHRIKIKSVFFDAFSLHSTVTFASHY